MDKNDVTQGEANSTSMPPNQKEKQNIVNNLSLYKHWLPVIVAVLPEPIQHTIKYEKTNPNQPILDTDKTP